MFWSKRRASYQPPTPKMAPVSLPFDHMPTPRWHQVPMIPTNVLRERQSNAPPAPSIRRHESAGRHIASTNSGWFSDIERKPKITSMPSDVPPRRGSQTPHPALSKPRYDLPQVQAHRTRKLSISSATDEVLKPLKGILKTSKVSVKDEKYVKPVVQAPPFDSPGSCKLDESDDCLKPHKSILKGSGRPQNVTTVHRMEKTSSHTERPAKRVPPYYPLAPPDQRPRNHSFNGHETHAPRAPPLDKYTRETHVVRVVQKEEAIALSWPLTVGGSSGRKRYPLVYFDLWFNPRYDPSAVKVYRDGFHDMPAADRNLSASSHCTLNEMDVTCPIMQTSFTIKIRRPDGIRCIDVFQEIFNAYDHRLRSEEQRALASEIDDRQGMRRVDLLKGKRIFNGLTRDPRSQTWLLEFHRPGE